MNTYLLPSLDRGKPWVWRIFVLTLWSSVIVVLSGCGPAPDPKELFAKAQAAADAGDYNTAVVQFKNTLQADPKNVEARWQLGQIYTKLSQVSVALKEFEKAADLGMKSDALTLATLQAHINLGQFKEVLKKLPGTTLENKPDRLLVIRGEAHLGLNDLEKARNAFQRAIDINPLSAEGHRGLSKIALTKKGYATALKHLDALPVTNTNDPETLYIKAEIELGQDKYEAAESAFRNVKEKVKNAPNSTLGLARSLIAQNRPEEAQKHVNTLHRAAPGSPAVNYLRALAAYQNGNLDVAVTALRDVLRAQPSHPSALFLTGSIAYERQELRLAEDHLTRFLAIEPEHLAARKLLAATHLALGQPKDAANVIEAIADDGTDGKDPLLKAMLGTAYLGLRDAEKGTELLEQATALDPDAPAIRAQLALSQLLAGSSDKAIASLKQASETDPTYTRADLLLMYTHLRNRDWDKAIAAGNALIAKEKDSPAALNLIGVAYASKDNLDKAREYYEKALAADETFTTATLNMAMLDLRLNRKAQAKQRYEAILAKDPKAEAASIALARMASGDGEYHKASKYLEDARKANPQALQPRLILSNLYLRQANNTDAFQVADEAARIAPKNLEAQLALGRAYALANDFKRAESILKSLAIALPDSPVPHLHLGMMLLRANDGEAARASLQRALELQPTHFAAKLALGELELRQGNVDTALRIAGQLKQLAPTHPGPVLLHGDINMRNGNYQAAIDAYKAALEQVENSHIFLKLYRAMAQSDTPKEATQLLTDWLKKHPNDEPVRLAAAARHYDDGNIDLAIQHYEEIVAASPNNASALNNLAWLYFETDDARAAQYAKRAYELAPQRPAVADTHGWILVQSGNLQQGLGILRRAARRAPEYLDIQYHLAVALAKTGDNYQAKSILEKVVTLPEDSPTKQAAKQLLQTL